MNAAVVMPRDTSRFLQGLRDNSLGPKNQDFKVDPARADLLFITLKLPETEREPESRLEICVGEGSQITSHKRGNSPDTLFVSECSDYGLEKGKRPIRGAIPIIGGWFGPNTAGDILHGYLRSIPWDYVRAVHCGDESVTLYLHTSHVNLAQVPHLLAHPDLKDLKFQAESEITLTRRGFRQLVTYSGDGEFQGGLHPYFLVGDLAQVELLGLEGHENLDGFNNKIICPPFSGPIRIDPAQGIHRLFIPGAGRALPPSVLIKDPALARQLKITGINTANWVAWVLPANYEKAKFPDLSGTGYLCAEPVNFEKRRVTRGDPYIFGLEVEVQDL